MSNTTGMLFLFSLLFSLGCSSQTAEKEKKSAEVEKFVRYLKANKPDEIYKMAYHTDSENSITNKESREFYVAQASELIKKHGLPPKEKWIYSHEPDNLVQRYRFRIPLTYDSLINKPCIELVVAFPPSQISEKVFDFSIDRTLDCLDFGPPVLPQSDTKGKN